MKNVKFAYFIIHLFICMQCITMHNNINLAFKASPDLIISIQVSLPLSPWVLMLLTQLLHLGKLSVDSHTQANMLKTYSWSHLFNFFSKHPWALALLPCVIAFLVQITTLADEMINPIQTVVNTRRMNLSQLETFPVVFKLCIQPGYNQTAIWDAGYSEVNL